MSDDFLSRWSRRKREQPSADTEAPDAPPSSEPAEAAVGDAELLAQLGLKHPDEMQRGDDFAGLLRAAVPQHLKTLALRRLWRSNPTLACLDGLNDYDGDFTGTGVPAGGLKTSYKVGRGLLRRIAHAAEDASADDATAPASDKAEPRAAEAARSLEPQATGGRSPAGRSAPPPSREVGDVTGLSESPAAGPADRDGHAQGAARRRMVFRSSLESPQG